MEAITMGRSVNERINESMEEAMMELMNIGSQELESMESASQAAETRVHPSDACAKLVDGKIVYGNGKHPTNADGPCLCPHAQADGNSYYGTAWYCEKGEHACGSQPTYEWRGHNAQPCPEAQETEYFCGACAEAGRLEHLWSPAPEAAPAHFYCRHGHWESVDKAEELKELFADSIESAFPGLKDALMNAPRETLGGLLAGAAEVRAQVLARASREFLKAGADVAAADELLAGVYERLRELAKLEDSPVYDIELAGTDAAEKADELDSILSKVTTLKDKLTQLAKTYGSDIE